MCGRYSNGKCAALHTGKGEGAYQEILGNESGTFQIKNQYVIFDVL